MRTMLKTKSAFQERVGIVSRCLRPLSQLQLDKWEEKDELDRLFICEHCGHLGGLRDFVAALFPSHSRIQCPICHEIDGIEPAIPEWSVDK